MKPANVGIKGEAPKVLIKPAPKGGKSAEQKAKERAEKRKKASNE